MSTPHVVGLPGPEPTAPQDEPQARSARRARGGDVPSERECLQLLFRLNGLLLSGLINSAQANAIRGNLTEILRYHRGAQAASPSGAAVDPSILERLRQDPTLITLLEPFMSDEQVASLVQLAGTRHE